MKFDRHESAVKQMAQRHAGTIAALRADANAKLHDRLTDVPIADQAWRIANADRWLNDLEAQIADPDTPLRDRGYLVKIATQLQRGVSEEMGDLRQRIDLGIRSMCCRTIPSL